MNITYSATRDSITVVVDGDPSVVRKGTANYEVLKKALFEERWDDVQGLVSVKGAIKSWANGNFTLDDDILTFKGTPVQQGISQRVLAMLTKGESPSPVLNFYERLDRNPSWRSVQQVFGFLAHEGIPLEPDGTFLAYKSVQTDYMDHYTGKISNKPGETPSVPRNKVSDDANTACHFGLHVGALSYAQSFDSGGRIVIVRVDPENVVCVPKDNSQRKMRCCAYEVVGDWNGHKMPSTTMETDKKADEREVTPRAPKGKDMPKAPKPKGTRGFIVTAEHSAYFSKLHGMDDVDLLKEPLTNKEGFDLRKYATYKVHVVGASKIPGGKSMLIRNIMEVRDGGGHK